MKDKTILITGGTSGIGLATARLLGAHGARLIVTGRNPDALEAARGQLPAGTVLLRSDSGSAADAQALGELVRTHVDVVDGVFLNAGTGRFGQISSMTPQLFDHMFNVNVRGPYFQLQGLLPLLANPSSVVLNASIAGQLGLAEASIYASTKAAVSSLGRTLAVELAGRGVRVNTISPGPIQTSIYAKLGMDATAQKGFEEFMAGQSLFKRMGTPDEVANLVRFLLSPESSYMVGVDVTIDGGVSLT